MKSVEIRPVEIPATYVGQQFDALCDYFRREKGAILIGYTTEDEGFRLEEALKGGNTAITDFITRQVQQAGISTTTKGRIQVHLNPSGEKLIEEGASHRTRVAVTYDSIFFGGELRQNITNHVNTSLHV